MKTCLVVDDGPLDRALLILHATSLGLKVTEASSGEEALTLCHTTLPDCILLDWEMPGMKGIELLEEIRRMENGASVCILICTSHEHASFIGHAFIKGANGYITKPITEFGLESKLREVRFL